MSTRYTTGDPVSYKGHIYVVRDDSGGPMVSIHRQGETKTVKRSLITLTPNPYHR